MRIGWPFQRVVMPEPAGMPPRLIVTSERAIRICDGSIVSRNGQTAMQMPTTEVAARVILRKSRRMPGCSGIPASARGWLSTAGIGGGIGSRAVIVSVAGPAINHLDRSAAVRESFQQQPEHHGKAEL